MRSAYYVIKLLNPRDGATVGYWRRDCWTPRLKNHLATRFSTAEEARGVGSGWMPDHEFGRFMAGWRVKPLVQIVKIVNPVCK